MNQGVPHCHEQKRCAEVVVSFFNVCTFFSSVFMSTEAASRAETIGVYVEKGIISLAPTRERSTSKDARLWQQKEIVQTTVSTIVYRVVRDAMSAWTIRHVCINETCR